MGLVSRVLPPPSAADYEQMIVVALRHQLSLGITASSDCGVTPQLLEVYRAVDAGGSPASSGQRHAAAPRRRRGDAGSAARALHLRSPARGHREVPRRRWIERRDGGAQRALPSRRHAGPAPLRPDDCWRCAARAHDAGWRIAVHVIGDVAIDQVLGIYEALGPHPRRPRPPAGALRPARRASARPGRPPRRRSPCRRRSSSTAWAATFATTCPDGFLPRCDPIRAMLDAGIAVALSSDAPVVEDDDPLMGMQAAITRRDREGQLDRTGAGDHHPRGTGRLHDRRRGGNRPGASSA